ncbi:MAG: YihA family ribosome biogenesis GTP-binding protein [Lamprocystis purpurea]|jgi:GTP-binding protein|uniref:ribosome biogenesis GTP-binding protein YihA/YsxC n=1 Tax=Lamprocystis purpurea TaxID=61598 RepID=UPI0003681DD1|nr:ribosome biogenesis GTP-binding protein YihA/YsxC [Lamprocystis purpurea]MBV5273106.1 YihA family ribosome biogenesis GTP-binding protein [Lamprocystis purpurea]
MNAFYQGAQFLTAATRFDQAPEDLGREVVFAGRSNAGKSSAINAICHQRALARTSKTPGRTQQLIFFRLDDERRLVDLPGYGYARVSESIKLEWQAHMAEFLERRRALAGLVIVMDIRHPLTDYDRQMLAWGRRADLPVLLLLTKADKLKRGAVLAAQLGVARETAAADGQVLVLTFSATERTGVESVQAVLDHWLGVAGLSDGEANPDSVANEGE